MAAVLYGPTNVIEIKQLVTLIYGSPGIGKTSIAQSTKRPFLFDFDKGIYRSVNRKHSGFFPQWSDLAEFQTDADVLRGGNPVINRYQNPDEQKAYLNGLNEYNLASEVIVDTVGRLLDLMTVQIISEDPKSGSVATGLKIQGWGILKTRFNQWINNLKSRGKDVILIAHEKEDKDGDNYKMRFDVQGGSKEELHKASDMIAWCYLTGHTDRFLEFRPRGNSTGKDGGQLGCVPVPDVLVEPLFLGNLIEKAKVNIRNLSAASVDRAKKEASAPPASPPASPPAATPPPESPPEEDAPTKDEIDKMAKLWLDWGMGDISLETFNRIVVQQSDEWKNLHKTMRIAIWNSITTSAKKHKWVWQQETKSFVEAK